MQQGYIVCEGDENRRIAVGQTLTLGRSIDCGLVIDDGAASRHHLEIVHTGNRFKWKDLGSTNGTIVNGHPMVEGQLSHGDRIRIGETILRFEVIEVEKTVKLDEPDDSTIFKEKLVGWQREGEAAEGEAKSESLLRAIFAVMNEIASTYEPCPLVDRILETTLRAIDAQRGTILFAGTSPTDIEPCPSCGKFHVIENGRLTHVEKRDIRISRTVANNVLSKGESLLFQDTDNASELNEAQSIMSLKLRSIICAPLRGKYGILGILYVDSDRPGLQYTHEDMLLSTAVGNSAGLALENATMHQKIVDKERTDQEIQHAWTIQEGFLVKDWPENEARYAVYGETRPAKIIGGDFYDFIVPSGNKVGLLIGDVSGKGIPAALTMAQLLAEFRIHAPNLESPAAVLKALNDIQCVRSQAGMFCTLCYVLLDLDTGKAICANAGHHPPLMLAEKGVRVFPDPSGPPVGILENATWSDVHIQVKKSETILLYTDGIVEARRYTGEGQTKVLDEFGMKRLSLEAKELVSALPRRIVDQINEAVRVHCHNTAPQDDCTMIALKYYGTGA
ncbi:MAG: hypothetical protein AMXMBFR84_22160 [Candidatus Hydrogenedentota bacterium]